jgi:hypothetical protein
MFVLDTVGRRATSISQSPQLHIRAATLTVFDQPVLKNPEREVYEPDYNSLFGNPLVGIVTRRRANLFGFFRSHKRPGRANGSYAHAIQQ